MAILNATDVTFTVGGVAVTHCTSASLSVNIDLRDATTKDSGGWSDSLGGLKSWEISGDAFVEISGSGAGQSDMFATLIGGAAAAVVFNVGADVYTGNAFITSLSIDGGVEENATYSISATGSDALELNA